MNRRTSSAFTAVKPDRAGFAKRILAELEGKTAAGWPIIPYPGVRSFTANEETIFFGRDDDVKKVREILTKQRCVVVLGGSGSGK
jgi:hypothetical protein